jgi:hypothetical protein
MFFLRQVLFVSDAVLNAPGSHVLKFLGVLASG